MSLSYGAPNLNEGRPWSEADLDDLRAALRDRDPVPVIASFLMRSTDEVEAKVAELRREEELRLV